MAKFNRIRFIVLLALLLAANAWAEDWVKVGSNETTTVYADFSTIYNTPIYAGMWGLLDLKTPDTATSKPYLSTKMLIVFNCQDEQYRFLTSTSYPENMGRGEAVYTDNVMTEWSATPPNSAVKTLWKTACGKLQG